MMSMTTSPRGNSARASSGVRAYVPYAILGTLTCIVAILVAEVFVQAMQPPPVADSLTISLLIDTSGSMRGESIAEVRDASIRFLKTWDRPNTHIAVIPFSDDAFIMEPILTMDEPDNPLIPKLQELEAFGKTSMLSALREAQIAFQHVGALHNAVMLFTDGAPDKRRQTLQTAQRMKERGTMVVAIGTAEADDAFLVELAGNPENVFTTRLGDFADTFDLAAEIISEGSFGTATTSQGLVVVLVVSLFLAAAMLVAENVWGLRGRWWRDLWWLPATGGIAGYAGGMVGEYVLGLGIVTWGLVGLSCGAALGLTDLAGGRSGQRSLLPIPPKSLRGALFGLIGGLAGGFVFAQFFRDVSLDTAGGELQALYSRLVGFAILGLAIGLAIKVGQELLKNTWLLGLTKGFYEGKQYILAKSQVSVGRAGNNDINLNQETAIADRVGHFVLESDAWHFVAARDASGDVTVDGQAVTDRARLTDGSSIGFGNTEFVFQSRDSSGTVTQADRWALVLDDDEFELPGQGRILLGSDASCDIVIRNPSVAGRHAVLEFSQHGLKLTALDNNIVLVNEVQLSEDGQSLQQGDFVMLGTVGLGLVKLFDP